MQNQHNLGNPIEPAGQVMVMIRRFGQSNFLLFSTIDGAFPWNDTYLPMKNATMNGSSKSAHIWIKDGDICSEPMESI
jgi:hypothetical protein